MNTLSSRERGPLQGGWLRAWLPTSSLIGFVAALIAVVVIAGISYDALRTRSEGAAAVLESLELSRNIQLVLSTLKDAETAERGYIITHDDRYLEPYDKALIDLPRLVAMVRRQLADAPDQLARFENVEHLIDDVMGRFKVGIGYIRDNRPDQATELVSTGAGKRAMDRVRVAVAELLDVERARLDTRTQAWEAAAASSTLVTWLGSLLLFTLIIAAMVLSSRDFRAQRTEAWLRSGQAGLSQTVGGEQTVEQVGGAIMRFIADYIGAPLGALFFLDSGRLRRVGAYGLPAGADASPDAVGGLTAEGLKAKAPLVVSDVPASYFHVTSAVGQAKPGQVVLAPGFVDGATNAVVELAFLQSAKPYDVELLGRVGETIATALRSAKYRRELVDLLEETRRQSEELQSQQEELRVNNEELEQQSKALQESQTRMENQQAELSQINAQLEEQTRALEVQRDDLTRAQTELQTASAYKSEFLANMSHELRTPLNSSLILARLLIENRQGNLNEEQIKYAQTIYSAGNDLLTLINDILDLSKIEAGKLDVRPENVTLARVVDELNDMFSPLAKDRKLDFAVNLERGLPQSIHTDPLRLQQVLKNLLSNAFKFTERGGVTLTVSRGASGRIAFAVKDTGIGIAPAQHAIIFEAFRQADGTTNRKHGGTGLGLSISRDLARLLGGEVRVDSAPGRGSTFTVEVAAHLDVSEQAPRTEAPAALRRPARPHTPPSSPAARPAPVNGKTRDVMPAMPTPLADDRDRIGPDSRTLLIIEDDLPFAGIVQELAREQQFLTLVANNAEDGLHMARRYRPSAIVLDVGLPDRSGLSVLDALKHSPATRHVPVHMCSVADYSQAALEMGAAGYAIKPVMREKLAEALQNLEAKFTQKVRKVLVVEDDQVHRESTCQLLKSDGVETIEAGTAAQALEQLGKHTFDCMVLDLTLPDRSGLKLLEEMSQKEQYSVPPVIVYTGKQLAADEEQQLRRFSSAIIIKGARSPERLLDEVTLFLHQVEEELPPDRQRMLRDARHRETVLEDRRLLVVEDDVRNIFALTSALEPRGAKVEIARNGREALDHLEQHPGVDLVLMDIMMPEMDGITAIKAIRKQPQLSKLPIIALTAKAMADDRDNCLAAGANDYIAKPLDLDKLLSLVRVWMPK
ncbi:MAG: response regulator [Archangiaceae bacterium]|nr:response regulator [Archangiaceae bacterium]